MKTTGSVNVHILVTLKIPNLIHLMTSYNINSLVLAELLDVYFQINQLICLESCIPIKTLY